MHMIIELSSCKEKWKKWILVTCMQVHWKMDFYHTLSQQAEKLLGWLIQHSGKHLKVWMRNWELISWNSEFSWQRWLELAWCQLFNMQSGSGHGGGTPGGKNNPPANLSLVSALYYDNYAYSPSLASIPGQSQEEGVKYNSHAFLKQFNF